MIDWNAERLRDLVEANSPEGQTLEFKSELPLRSDKGRSEFLKDVSAFANSVGGSLLYGVAEKNGVSASLTDLNAVNLDAEVRRLAQTVEAGIEPRLSGLRFTSLTTDSGSHLVVDVPESFDGPHRYTFNGHSKFVQRSGTHVAELSYDQLRSAFNRNAARLDRLRDAWGRDLSLNHTWKPLLEGPVAVIRISSLLSADGKQTLDPKRAEQNWSDLIQSDWQGGSPFYNYEGLAVAPGRNEAHPAYTQVHRTGAISSFRTCGVEFEGHDLFIPERAERFFLEASQKALAFLLKQGIGGSAILHAGIVRLSDWTLAFRDGQGLERRIPSQVDRIELPELLIDDIQSDLKIMDLMRPGFDMIWQAYGRAECPHFKADGTWSGD